MAGRKTFHCPGDLDTQYLGDGWYDVIGHQIAVIDLALSLLRTLDKQWRVSNRVYTGSAFGIAAFFGRTSVSVKGESSSYTRESDSGFDITFHFCPNCGSSVFWEPSRKPEFVAIAVGAFADPEFPAPTQSVHEEHQHLWLIHNI